MSGGGIAFRTWFCGTPPKRAISTPQCKWSSWRIECASIENEDAVRNVPKWGVE